MFFLQNITTTLVTGDSKCLFIKCYSVRIAFSIRAWNYGINTTYRKLSTFVEIKCQLDATDELLLQILLLAQYVSGTIMPIIRSSGVLYKWLLPVVFGAWFSSCRYSVELRVVCHYAHHQELGSIIQVVAACRIRCLVFKLSVWCGAEGCVSLCPSSGAREYYTSGW
jgi:hypothetical protein